MLLKANYPQTDMTVDLGGHQDQDIVREASAFWRESSGCVPKQIQQSRRLGSNAAQGDSVGTWRISNASSSHTQRNPKPMRPLGNWRTSIGSLKANVHVKREYTDRETGERLRQKRDGISVPQLRQEECIDMMVDACGNMELHLNAAKG